MRSIRKFSYAHFCLEVEADQSPLDQTLLDWLEEFLEPSFSTDSLDEVCWKVLCRPFNQNDETLKHEIIEDGALIDAFTLDGSFEQLLFKNPVEDHTTDNNQLLLCDPQIPAVCYCDHERRIITLALGGQVLVQRYFVMKVLRELTTSHLLSQGAVPLHGAALTIDVPGTGETGIVISGPKNAGKSTLLIAGLLSQHGHFIANDRCFLKPTESIQPTGEFSVRGMPTIVKLRKASIELFPQLATQLQTSGFDAAKRFIECQTRKDFFSQLAKLGHKSISGPQLGKLTNSSSRAEHRVSLVVFLGNQEPYETQPSSKSGSVKPVSPTEAENLLRENLFGLPSGPVSASAFTSFDTTVSSEPTGQFHSVIGDIAHSIPCIRYAMPEMCQQEEILDESFWPQILYWLQQHRTRFSS